MKILDRIFRNGLDTSIEGFRKSIVQLKLLQKAVLLDTFEYKRMQKDWKPVQVEMEKGQVSESIQTLNERYKSAIAHLEKSFQDNSKKQEEIKKAICNQIKSNPSLVALFFMEDFIPEDKYNELAISLVKGHKEGKIKDSQLKKLTQYKKNQLKEEGEKAYVKDNRTQYADCILIDDENKILFTVRNKNDDFCPGGYCLPGGHIEDGETPREAAARELMEETGIELQLHELVPCGEYIDNKSHIYYYCARTNTEPVVLEEREQQQWEKVPFDEIDKKPLILNLQHNLEELVAIPRDILNKEADNAQKVYFDGKKFKKGAENLFVLKSLEGSCAIIKATGECSIYEQEQPSDEELQKAYTKTKLVPKKIFVTRRGKTYLTTVWVNPETGEIKEKPGAEEREVEYLKWDDVMVGDGVLVTTKKGTREGIVECLVKTKEGAYIGFRTPEGKYTEAYLKSITDLSVSHKLSGSSDYDEFREKVLAKKEEATEEIASKDTTLKIDFSELPKLGGSSETYLWTLGDDTQIFIKKARTGREEQLKYETLADKVYDSLGFKTPNSIVKEVVDEKTGEAFTCKMYPYLEGLKEYGSLTRVAKEYAEAEIRKGFALDCLLANWDVIGGDGDNILCTPDGKTVWRIDNGSTFQYRAKGALKGGFQFLESTTVEELDSMRNGSKAEAVTRKVFGSLTDEDVCKQIKELSEQKDLLFVTLKNNNAGETVIQAIERRLGYMEKWAADREALMKEKSMWDEAPTDPEMQSKVSEVYFSTWDDLILKGYGKLKETLKEGILKTEKNRESGYRQAAEKMGMSLGEYKAKLQKLAEDLCSCLTPGITLHTDGYHEAFTKVFKKGGRWKSLFETGDGCGCTSKSIRADFEKKVFGFPEDTSAHKELRPIYGYSTNNDKGLYGGASGARSYGDVFCQIKKSKALESATITMGDSLNHEYEYFPVPFAKPHFVMFNNCDSPFSAPEIIESIEKFIHGSEGQIVGQGSYLEMQYHDQLSAKDVDTVHFRLGKNSRTNKSISMAVNALVDLARSGEEGTDFKVDIDYIE